MNNSETPIKYTYTITPTVKASYAGGDINISGEAKTVQVTVEALPTAPVISGGTNLCAGGSLVLTASVADGDTYQWMNRESVIDGANGSTYTATEEGRYTVKVSNANGCQSPASEVKVITVNLNPVAPSISTPDNKTSFCAGGSLVLMASVADGDTYQWMNRESVIDGANGSTYTATASGSYNVRITRGSCSSFSTPKQITVHPLPESSIKQVDSELRVVNVSSGKHQWQWYLEGQKIEGATLYNYSPTQTGKYQVQTTNEYGCSVMSKVFEFKATRVRRSLDGDFMIYPNPNKGHFWIKKPSEVEIAELRVYDMLGREYHRVKTKQTEVNIPGLAGGMYFLEIITKPQEGYAPSRTKKFIVK